MRTRTTSIYAGLLALILFAVVAASDGGRPMKGGMTYPEAGKPEAKSAAATAAIQLGKPDSARWTATTYEAATAEANKKVLASGRPVTVTGEVVDVSCYMQLGKRGEAHIACGTKCIEHGQPIGLLDAGENLYILFAEEHHPRRDGQVELKKVFAPLLAKTVKVSGMMTDMKGYRALFVRAAEIGGAVEPDTAGTGK